ncbi:MAG: V-type ATP synthase subunit D [Pyrodictiaceae archaeon]
MGFEQRKVLPTKINLIRLRREQAMLKKIRKVLEEKRDVLLLYIRQTAKEYEESYRRAAEKLEKIYRQYFVALSTTGLEQVASVAERVPTSLDIDVSTRVLFAVRTPAIEVMEETIPSVPPGLARLPPGLLALRGELVEALASLLRVAETELTLRRLLEELRQTQRLINALDYNLLPRYESAIKFIKLILDDRMREDVMRLKMLKRKLEERRTGKE